VADLEIFRGCFGFIEMPAKLEAKTKKTNKKSHHQLVLLAAASLPFSIAPKPTH